LRLGGTALGDDVEHLAAGVVDADAAVDPAVDRLFVDLVLAREVLQGLDAQPFAGFAARGFAVDARRGVVFERHDDSLRGGGLRRLRFLSSGSAHGHGAGALFGRAAEADADVGRHGDDGAFERRPVDRGVAGFLGVFFEDVDFVADGDVAQAAFDHLGDFLGAVGIEQGGVDVEAALLHATAGDHADGIVPVVVEEQRRGPALDALEAHGLGVVAEDFGAVPALDGRLA
jgi:hypothetical protein